MSKGVHRPRRARGINFEIADWGFGEDGISKGPWFAANYSSTLSCCGDECEEGDEIRADGDGGYEGRCCFPEGDE